MMPSPRRVVVIQTAWLGDVILTTPLFRAVKRRWPETRVEAVVIPGTAPVLEGLTDVDGVIVHDKRRGGWRDFRRTARALRAGGFDLCLAPHRSARTAVLARTSGAAVRVGYRESALPFLYTARVRRPRAGHEVERILALGAPFGLELEGPVRPRLAVTEEERRRAAAVTGGRPYVVISPSSAWPTKRWRAEGFAAVADDLTARGLTVVLTGAPGEEPEAAAVAAASRRRAVNLAGRTTVRELAALVAGATAVVANDSAPVHLASAFNRPTVAIFGATVPAQGFGPLAARAAVAEVTGLACRPCGAHGGRKCPKKHFKCMNELSADAVLAAVAAVLE